MKRTVSGLLFCSLLITAAYAGMPIRGFVIDATSGEPLPVANVILKGSSRGASTNLDGFFIIPGLTKGTYTLEIAYLGYERKEVNIQITDQVMEPISIELIPASMAMKEVVFKVDKEDDDQVRQSARVSIVPVNNKTIRMLPSLGAEMDVLRAMQAIPGVKASSEMSSALYVRGGSSGMTLIQMDQSTVYNPSHLFGLFSTFNADAVKHIELMKGGFPARYGGRGGSVLEVITNDGNRRKHEGLVSMGIISAKAALEGPLPKKRGSYAISGRRTYFDPVINMLKKNEEFKDLPMYFFYDGNGKINLDISPKTTLTIGGYTGHDRLTSEFGPEDSRLKMETDWGNKTFMTRLRQVLTRDGFLTFGIAYSKYKSNFLMENEDSKLIDFDNSFRDFAGRVDFEYHGFRNHHIETGLEYRRYSTDFRQQDENVEYVHIDFVATNISHYIQDRITLGSHWEILPGIRSYYHNKGNQYQLDPRLAIMYSYDQKTRFKLAGGRYHQWLDIIRPAGDASDFATFLDVWTPNDGSVDPMYTDQIVFGIEHDPSQNLQFTFETYYTWMKDVNEYNQVIDRGESTADAFLKGDGYAYGFEWMLRQKTGRLSGWIGYSLSWTKRRFPNERYVNNGNWFYPKHDRRHDFIFVSNYQLSEKWAMSASWRYNTGQGYTRALGMFTVYDPMYPPDSNPNSGRDIRMGSRNNYRLPADHRLDLNFIYSHTFFKLPAKLNISLYNLYNHRSIWFRHYDEGENPVEVSDIRLLPVLPLVSYEVRF